MFLYCQGVLLARTGVKLANAGANPCKFNLNNNLLLFYKIKTDHVLVVFATGLDVAYSTPASAEIAQHQMIKLRHIVLSSPFDKRCVITFSAIIIFHRQFETLLQPQYLLSLSLL